MLGARATTTSQWRARYVSCPHRVYNPGGKLGVKKLECEYYIQKSDASGGRNVRAQGTLSLRYLNWNHRPLDRLCYYAYYYYALAIILASSQIIIQCPENTVLDYK